MGQHNATIQKAPSVCREQVRYGALVRKLTACNWTDVMTCSPIFWRLASGRLQLDGAGATLP